MELQVLNGVGTGAHVTGLPWIPKLARGKYDILKTLAGLCAYQAHCLQMRED
jgi:hypothetical protein